MIVSFVICDACGVVWQVVDLHNGNVVLQRMLETFACFSGIVMRLVQTPLCVTVDCASNVLYCVAVFGCALVCSMASWNCSALWSSLYSPHAAINNWCFVIKVPFSFVSCHAFGILLIAALYRSSV